MLSFCHFDFLFPPFFKRDLRLKKRSKCPSWRSQALCRTRCQGRGFCVHRSEVKSLDRTSGRGSALLRREGQRDEKGSQAERMEGGCCTVAAKLPGAGIGPKQCPRK